MKYRTKRMMWNGAIISLFLMGCSFVIYYAISSVRSFGQSSNNLVKLETSLSSYPFIQELSDTQFDDLYDVPDHYIVYFYAPWCTHCVEFLEEYNTLAESMADETQLLNGKKRSHGYKHDSVKFFYLNCEKYGDICHLPELNIQSYPTAVAFNFKFKETISRSSLWDELRQDAISPVTVESIRGYVHAHHFAPKPSPFFYEGGSAVTELSDLELLEAMQRPEQPIVAVFYVSWCTHCKQLVEHFQAVARSVEQTSSKMLSNVPNNSQVARADRPIVTAPPILFAAINCELFRDTCFGNALPIEYYPTIIAFNINADRPIEVVARDRLEDYLRDMHFTPLETRLKEANYIEQQQQQEEQQVVVEEVKGSEVLPGIILEEPVYRQLQTKLRVAS